jgi:diguanylate cyclase (GGDEF)-like protein
MAISLDPATMFIGLVASTFAAVLLLLWTWVLNRHERSLLWVAVGFLLGSISILAIAGRETLPKWISIELGVAVLLAGIGLVWVAARTFNSQSPRGWVVAVGPVIWLIACRIPGFVDNFDARMILSSLIIGCYYVLAAIEIRRGDRLRTRIIASAVLLVQAAFVLVRVPLVVIESPSGTLSFADTSWFSISALEAVIFVQVISFLMISLTKERVESRLRAAALTDALTGLANRRAFFEWAEAAIARGARNGSPVSAIVFDLDRFKEINDRFGHPVGDAVIQTFAAATRSRLRAGDFVARLGGEEFAVALPDTTGAEACLVALQINQAFEAAVAAMAPGGLSGTACAGVADTSGTTGCTLEDLITAADRALYEAKDIGRGQVRLSEAPAPRFRVRAA